MVAMYNEQEQAERCVRTVCSAIDELPARVGMIVVDDGSADATAEVLARLRPQMPPLTVISHSTNEGYGAALQTGSARAAELGFDYAVFMDSDLTNDPRYLSYFFARMRAGYDVIKASRYVTGGRAEGVPPWRRYISIVGNGVARMLLRIPIRDCTNGFRAVRTTVLSQMKLHENGFPVIMEELYQAKFLARSFCEFPYTLTSRSSSLRPSSFAYRPGIFWRYLKYPLRAFFGLVPAHLARPARTSDGGH